MKKKVSIGVAITLAIVVGIINYLHKGKVDNAKSNIERINEERKTQFLSEKDSISDKFSKEYPDFFNLFEDYFSTEKAEIVIDTTISTFVFSTELDIKEYESDYLNCVFERSVNEVSKIKAKRNLKNEFRNLRNKYGSDVNLWKERINNSKLFNTPSGSPECGKFFTSNYKYSINRTALKEFEELVVEYQNHKAENEQISYQNKSNYESSLSTARRKLNYKGENFFDKQVNQDKLLTTEERFYSYTGDILGQLEYSFTTKVYKKDKLYDLLERSLKEQYKDNSLYTGAKPYASCYGTFNSCSGYSCSEIEVQASHNSDVIVTIKKNGNVVRHAYIQAGDEYSFELSNGTYQPFFYYGNGWNPDKDIEGSDCRRLEGGFVSDEHIGKDSPQRIYQQILTYELIEQIGGNFQTRPSSKGEAF
ncbi:MAG: hypothetical protein ACQETL_18845 [Bacteroidota bacterium]